MGKLTETEVPPLSPKLREGGGAERRRHNGFGLDAETLPKQSDYLEATEVEEQDQTDHPCPSPQKWLSKRNGSRYNPEQDSAESSFERRPEPSPGYWRRYVLSRIQESICIHSRPSEKIG
jgi:hypothetical protein